MLASVSTKAKLGARERQGKEGQGRHKHLSFMSEYMRMQLSPSMCCKCCVYAAMEHMLQALLLCCCGPNSLSLPLSLCSFYVLPWMSVCWKQVCQGTYLLPAKPADLLCKGSKEQMRKMGKPRQTGLHLSGVLGSVASLAVCLCVHVCKLRVFCVYFECISKVLFSQKSVFCPIHSSYLSNRVFFNRVFCVYFACILHVSKHTLA